jgi:hypothetical protein
MKRLDVRKKGDTWVAESSGRAVLSAATKAEAVRLSTAEAKRTPGPVSVRIHNMDGRIQEERTYPRGADPRRSKG